MKLADYLKKRKAPDSPGNAARGLCLECRRSPVTCICRHIKIIDPKIKFVILAHLREAQNRIATGRLSHQSLANSEFIIGTDFTRNEQVNAILSNPENDCVILYPGSNATNLSQIESANRPALFPANKTLVVFVIDGTWFTAPKILRLSENLHALPRICFDPPAPSRFRIRRQPKPYCHSTVEAIHQVIELIGESRGFSVAGRAHDHLLFIFEQMVEQQIEFGAREKILCQWSPRASSRLPQSKAPF
jgi:DTW domain-containing protein YfiP